MHGCKTAVAIARCPEQTAIVKCVRDGKKILKTKAGKKQHTAELKELFKDP